RIATGSEAGKVSANASSRFRSTSRWRFGLWSLSVGLGLSRFGLFDIRDTPEASGILASLAPPHPHIQRPLAAMGNVRILEAGDRRGNFRRAKPVRSLPLQNTALAVTRTCAFARDHQHKPRAAGTGRAQKAQQSCVGFALRQPMQIEPAVERFLATGDALL